MKYIDADRLRAEIEKLKGQLIRGACAAMIEMETNCKDEAYNEVLSFIDSLQQEQPNDLASLISEATNVAKRIVDRDSFYNSLPQNLRDKYTSKAWCEILKALSTMKEQEQPEVDEDFFFDEVLKVYDGNDKYPPRSEEELTMLEIIARHFYELGKQAMKEQMMENAVEGKVFMSFVPGHNQMVMADVDLPTNTKVKIIIVKEEEE